MTSAGTPARKAKIMNTMTAPYNTPVTATTAEESIRIAMHGAAFVAVPAVLVGVEDLSGTKMEPTVYAPPVELEDDAEPIADESDALPIELAEGETVLADLRDEMVIFETVDDIAEVVALTQDQGGMEWVVFTYSDGETTYAAFDQMGEDVQIEILAAWDRQTVKNLRKSLVAA